MASIWDKPFTEQSPNGNQYSSNPYFDPNSNYGAESNGYDSPISGTIREQNPELAYAMYGQNMGVSDQNTAFRDWFFNQYPEFQRGHGMALLQNPFLTMDEYTSTLPSIQALQQIFRRQDPYARGERNPLYAPIARWITR